ncbi:MAG: hypothetical protein H0V70_01525 [Ktedonobacteraceae bacterium]|nr:hypothetical protein [Ktedonobacteraceae bacterium]
MSKIDGLLQEHSLHSVRSDGSQMIALATGQTQTGSEWEILLVRKNGSVDNDGTLILGTGEKAVLRKTYNNEKLQEFAALHDFVEWRPSVFEEHPGEHSISLQDKLQQTERDLQEVKNQYVTVEKQHQEAQNRVKELMSSNATQRRKEKTGSHIALEEVEERIKSTAAAIAERTPSHTQKIIANQVELGAGFYEEVGVQSHESFRLSLWLAVAGGAIFLLTVVATVIISLYRGDNTLITIIGSVVAGLTEVLAASNRLYNQASQQFANFQIYLDRINRSSICYTMVSEEAFEKKTQKQQEAIVKIIDTLLKE